MSIRESEAEIRELLNVAGKRPGTNGANNSLARIPVIKARLRETREILAAHSGERVSS